jgi:hypothetical protein
MNKIQKIDLLGVKRVLETSKNCLSAIVSVVEDELSKRKCLSDLEATNHAILTINKLLKVNAH